ncbi:MAG: hypothetical protein EOO02_12755, partial [Chitinophagaceae bacterium]
MTHPYQSFLDKKIILASQSPRRKQLLEWAEVPFEVVVVPTEETYPASLSLPEVPIHIAKQKAMAVREFLVQNNITHDIIIAADTI